MTPSLLVNLLLFFLFIPAAYGLLWSAQRYLPSENPLRKTVERHGIAKLGKYLLFATYAIGGTVLAILYS